MKNLKIIITTFLIGVTVTMNGQSNPDKRIKEAALNGKADLIKILSTNKDFNFGVSPRDAEASQPASPIEEFTTDFKSLLNDNVRDIFSISRPNEKFIVPLTTNNKVITTISIASNSKSTKVVEFINQQFTTELNELSPEIKRKGFEGVKIVRVPNIDAILYIYGDKSFTSYNGKNIKEPLNTSDIIRELQVDARKFQAEFGDQLKKGKLVK